MPAKKKQTRAAARPPRKAAPAARRKAGAKGRPAGKKPSGKRPAGKKRSARRLLSEQPLGAGVGDAHAVKRLRIPPQQSRARPQTKVREVSWLQFGDFARDLADRIALRYRPEVILGVVNGGVFLGGALAGSFQAEFVPVKIDRRSGLPLERLPSLAGKKVLAVDDVTVSGRTLSRASLAAEKAGAAEVRTCALVVRPKGSHSDFFALETDEVVVFGWDYQLDAGAGPGGADPGEVGV
ncbi:MAG: phosphoribosyltransferase [Deltaproteobacteria bacterium]|nr:phosphoribosyltransferase [Deltaproteobacteria bacterium]